MAYDVLSHFDERTAAGGLPVSGPVLGWSVWRVGVGDLRSASAFIVEELVNVRAALVVLDEEEQEQARLRLDFARRILSGNAAVIEGSDASGGLRVAAGVEQGGNSLKLTLTVASEGRTPATSLPALRFLSFLRPGRRVGLWLDTLGDWAATPASWEFDAAVDEGYLAAVETLDQVQRATGTSFPTPAEFTSADLDDLQRAVTLLSGDALTSTWKEGTCIMSHEALEWVRSMQSDFVGRIEETGTYDVTVAGHDMRVGVISQTVHHFVLAEEDPMPDGAGRFRVRVLPGSDNVIERKLVTRAYFDPFARDLERVTVSEDEIARVLRGKSLRDHLRSA